MLAATFWPVAGTTWRSNWHVPTGLPGWLLLICVVLPMAPHPWSLLRSDDTPFAAECR
jgi:hypothetical protein